MRFLSTLFLLLLLCSGADATAQCLCGSLRFTVRDSASGEVAPHPRGQIGRDSVSVVSGMFSVWLSSDNDRFPPSILASGKEPRFYLPTGAGYRLLVLQILREDVLMTVEISNVAMDVDYDFGTITFRGGVYALDLADARRLDSGPYGFSDVDSQLVLMRKLPRR
jgi:hypothetical protein